MVARRTDGRIGSPSAPGGTARRSATVKRLIRASQEIFYEIGVEAASIEQICERAGFSRGAFYSNFKTKEDLLIAIYDAEADRMIASLAETIAAIEGDNDPLHAWPTHFAKRRYGGIKWWVVFQEFVLFAYRNVEVRKTLSPVRARVRGAVIAFVRDLMRVLDRELTVTEEEAARYLTLIHHGDLSLSLMDPEKLTPGHYETELTGLLIDRLSRPKREPKSD